MLTGTQSRADGTELPAPLTGVKVLELARILAGPWAGQVLADLGADVIKVEAPGGDDTRSWGPPFIEREGSEDAAYFHNCNRGKRSVVADFGTAEGRALVERLASEADVLIENFKTGSLAKFGLDFGSIARLNPRIVYCSITGFGQDGPYAHRPGYDYLLQGMGGLMSVTGDPAGVPQKVGVPVVDMMTGLYSTIGILAAVHQARATGIGQRIDMALMDVAAVAVSPTGMNYLATGNLPRRDGNNHPNLAPYGVFSCLDGNIILAPGNDRQFAILCDILDCPELSGDERFRRNRDRLENRGELLRILSQAVGSRSKHELMARCDQRGIPAGPINNIQEAYSDPQITHRAMVGSVDGIPVVRSPFHFSKSRLSYARPAPALDEHRADISWADPAAKRDDKPDSADRRGAGE